MVNDVFLYWHTKGGVSGVRRASAIIAGEDVYKDLKYESGVHRVQRVPRTEKTSRIHTSTMTVAVLPRPSEVSGGGGGAGAGYHVCVV